MSAALRPALPIETRVSDWTFEKYAKFKPQSVVIMNRFRGTTPATQTNEKSLVNLEKGKNGQYNGYMSPATRRKVRGIVENFLTAIQLSTPMAFPKSFPSLDVYPTFLTLTLPSKQLHCDNDIKEIFARFMEYLTGSAERGNSGWHVKNYIWVSETQKNGNIHFHVILDRAVLAASVQAAWNRFIERLGYITRFRNRQNYLFANGFYVRKDMLNSALARAKDASRKGSTKFDSKQVRDKEIERQKRAYEKGVKAGWNNPPTADIHKIESIKKLTAYVSKYMTKEPEIITPALAPGETLVQENGKYFAKSTTVEKFISIEGFPLETVTEDVREIEIKFVNRRLRGRIWGASTALHTELITPLEIVLETIHRVTVTTVSQQVLKVKRGMYTENLLGERIFMGFQVVNEIRDLTTSKSDMDTPIIDHGAKNWVNWLENEHVPIQDIERATARAGEHFASSGGKVIPLEHAQKDLLKAHDPEFYARYVAYYQSMFQALYGGEHAA